MIPAANQMNHSSSSSSSSRSRRRRSPSSPQSPIPIFDEDAFQIMLNHILVNSGLDNDLIDILTNPESLKFYRQAFTCSSVNPDSNYEVFEQLGDAVATKFLVYYFYKRFPFLRCNQGVKVIARLRINYAAKNTFYRIAERLGFWPFVMSNARDSQKKNLLEDVFEAFLGCTEMLVEQACPEPDSIGVGYCVCYKIMAHLFDQIDISLKFTDLYDAKTRIKELYDYIGPDRFGKLRYEDTRSGDKVTSIIRASGEVIGRGVAYIKIDAQQRASETALEWLRARGFFKPPPPIYAQFQHQSEQLNTRKCM